MRHLSPEQFVDAMDGTASGAVLEHADACASCRSQLNELKALAQMAEEVAVPEPSALYWEHLSDRVRTAVDGEAAHNASPLSLAAIARRMAALGASWRVGVPAAVAVAAVAVALFVRMPQGEPGNSSQPAAPSSMVASSGTEPAVSAALVDGPNQIAGLADASSDEPLAFVADLASGLDWNVAAEIGLTPSGGVESTVIDLDDAERVELQRILHEAIGSGVSM